MTRIMMAAIAAIALSATALSAQSKAPAPKTAATATAPVNLNTATAEQLATIPGVGPKMAERIIDYRQKNGGFKKVEEILETSRFCPYSLSDFDLGSLPSVSGSR